MSDKFSAAIFNTNRKFVSVIASFDNKGNIYPLYVRIDGVSLKILSYVLTESTGYSRSFECRVQDNDYYKNIRLSYHISSLAWFIEYSL